MHTTYFAPENKKSSVYGRYMLALLLFIFCLAINLLADLIAPYFYAEYISGDIYLYILMFVVYFVLVSINIPLLYWQGYARARFFQYLLFMSVALFIVKVIGAENLYHFITDLGLNIQLLLLLIAASIILLICSLCMSVKIYSKKDI